MTAPTPRTDAAVFDRDEDCSIPDDEVVTAEFARTLERDLAAHSEALNGLLTKWRARMAKYEEESLEASGKGDTEEQLATAGVWGELRMCIRELDALARIQSLTKEETKK